MSAHCTAETDLDWANDLACQIIADYTGRASFNCALKIISARLRQLKLEGEAEGLRQARYAVQIP